MTVRPRILMLTTQLGYGGAETSFIRLANFLAQSMEVTVALFTSDYGGKNYSKGHEPLNANVVLLDDATPTGRLQRWWRRIAKLRTLKAQHQATISFLSGPNLVNVLAGYNRRTIVSLRGSRHYDPVSPRWQRRFFQYVIDPLVFRLAARIVPVSAGLKNEIRAAAGEAAVQKTVVISPFVEHETLKARSAEPAPTPYEQLKGQPVIVGVGRLSIEKGFQHLIRVFAEVSKTQRDAKLLLVGDGPMLATLRAQCAALGLPMDDVTPGIASVVFAGYQKNALPLMALARVYAMTSATEGFPSVLLEAMVAGAYVIAADTPWGARAVLVDTEETPEVPYPTIHPVLTKYGTLMRRIDSPLNQAVWSEGLISILRGINTPSVEVCKRPQSFAIDRVGARWRRLIEEMDWS